MKISTYKKEIKSRQALFRRIQRLNTHLPFMLRSQVSYLATPIDKLVLYQKVNCYKGKKLLIEEDDNAPTTKYAKARPGRLFKHQHEAMKQKTKLTILDWYVMKRYYRLMECCFDLEPYEKPPADIVYHEIRLCY